MADQIPSPASPKYVGGNAALDFANSLRGRDDGVPRGDHLNGYDDLVAWGEGAGLIDRREGKRLKAEAARRPRESAQAFGRAIALRETIYRLFRALADGRRPARADLDALNAALAASLPHQRLVEAEDGFGWGWEDTPDLNRVLWPVLRAAAELLTSDRLPRVRECGGDHCGWLFLDETKNRSRRWCEMSVCGNRAKARRHYDRSRQASRS
jgi:predicted RNA-binding Zn ribbon-like protein